MGAEIALFTPICHACAVLSIQRLGMIPIALQTIKLKESAACLLRAREMRKCITSVSFRLHSTDPPVVRASGDEPRIFYHTECEMQIALRC